MLLWDFWEHKFFSQNLNFYLTKSHMLWKFSDELEIEYNAISDNFIRDIKILVSRTLETLIMHIARRRNI